MNNNNIINTNNKSITSVFPIISYSNADTHKVSILNENKEKLVSINELMWYLKKVMLVLLSRRLKNYYNISYLETEIKKKK